MSQPAQVLQRIGHTLQEMRLTLVESAEAIGPHSLQDTHVNIGVIVLHEGFAVQVDVTGEAIEIVVEQLLTQLRRQIGFAVVEQGGNVVLQRAFAAALIGEKIRLAVAQHYIARLKVAIEKIISLGGQQKLGEAAEIMLQRLFVERDTGQAQKIILEIVQIPGDGLAVEAGPRIADFVIKITARIDLKTRQLGHYLAIGFDGGRSDDRAVAITHQKIEERGVAEVLFEVCVVVEVLRINLRDRQAAAAKMPRELQERDILFANGIENADGGFSSAGEADDGAAGGAKLALKRLYLLGGQPVMLFEKLFQNFHESLSGKR